MLKDLNRLKQRDTHTKAAKVSNKKIAKRYKLHPKSVLRICRRYKQRKTVERKRGLGRKPSLSKVDKQRIRN